MEKRAETSEAPSQVHFCALPAGQSACTTSTAFDAPSKDSETSEYVSDDMGASFAARSGVGMKGVVTDMSPGENGAYNAADDHYLSIDEYDFHYGPTADAKLGFLSPFAGGSGSQGAVSFLGAGATFAPVAVWTGRAAEPGTTIRFKYLDPPGVNPNAAGNWKSGNGNASIGQGTFVAMATGPQGIVLLSASTEDGAEKIEARRYDPAAKAFGAPVLIAGVATGDDAPDSVSLYQDPTSGRLHALWYQA